MWLKRIYDAIGFETVQETVSPKSSSPVKSDGKIMATAFWDTQRAILVDFLSRGQTVNSDSYIDTLKRLQVRILRMRPDMDIGNVLLLHDNARPHSSIRTRETIASFV
ncbi:mariner transposase [Elysia marginata]|uniref:Mariner transposase n=1 Tax=Elysia marginata TaxID=1093978 RepID=A0AAV4ETP4_9GAST|nr:mariner transposase [Elysia marginata]